MIVTLEKKVVRGVSSVAIQQQQLSIDIVTNLSIKTSINTWYYRKSAVSKQKASSRSRYILLSSRYILLSS